MPAEPQNPDRDDAAAELVAQQDHPGDEVRGREDLIHAVEADVASDELSSGARRAAEALADVTPEPGSRKADPILVASGVSRTFGGLKAVDVEHVEIQRGTITALIGPNGAGKTTFFNVITGFDKANTGQWSLNGESLAGKAAYRIARKGMIRTFQLTKALQRLSALENVKLGATGQKGERLWLAPLTFPWRRQEKEIEARADELLARFNLRHMRDEFAGTMSGGQRKLLEMARALMSEPDMILLDEPMAGVNPALTQSLLGHIQSLRDEGMTIVLVEHDMDVIMSISDWIVCFAEGRVIAEGRPEDIRSNEKVIEAYLGTKRGLPGRESGGATAASTHAVGTVPVEESGGPPHPDEKEA